MCHFGNLKNFSYVNSLFSLCFLNLTLDEFKLHICFSALLETCSFCSWLLFFINLYSYLYLFHFFFYWLFINLFSKSQLSSKLRLLRKHRTEFIFLRILMSVYFFKTIWEWGGRSMDWELGVGRCY